MNCEYLYKFIRNQLTQAFLDKLAYYILIKIPVKITYILVRFL